MGQIFSRTERRTENNDVEVAADSNGTPTTRKRKGNINDGGALRKKKISKLDTPKYIHKRLFIDGAKSDITICALGRTWNLHRLYLEQCKFFDSMFKGQWKDSNEATVQISIVDPNITVEGFNMVLESLYHNEIEIDLDIVPSLIASASMLSLDSVMERCAELCVESLSDEHVMKFYTLGDRYGLPDLCEKCYEYLKCRFWRLSRKLSFLCSVSHAIMAKLVSAPNLLVLEGEVDLYETVKRWIFLQSVPNTPEENELQSQMENFYSSLSVGDRSMLRCTFADVLCHIRIAHIASSVKTVNDLRKDPLIPSEIIDQVLADQWISLLLNEEGNGPVEISEEQFYLNAHRLGRILDTSSDYHFDEELFVAGGSIFYQFEG